VRVDVDWGRLHGATTLLHLSYSCGPFVLRHLVPLVISRPPLVKDGITGKKWLVNLACDSDFHVNHRVLLSAANRHGTDGLGKHAVDFFA
jgi:hypothetical protein